MGIARRVKERVMQEAAKASRSAASFVAEALRTEGVERVFTIPGVLSLELVDALAEQGPKPVLVTHESSAAFMADAIGRAFGSPGVFFVVPGPGIMNALSGIAASMADQIPVLCIVAGARKGSGKSFLIHEMPQREVLSPLVKDYLAPSRTEEIGPMVARAFRICRQAPPGPVVLELGPDLLEGPCPAEPYRAASSRPQTDRLPTAEVERAVKLLLDHPRAMIYAGKGAFHASRQVMDLAEILGAPVATTISGRGILPEDHRLSLGFGWGPAGTERAQKAFSRADLVFGIGVRFSEMATGGFSMPDPPLLIHLDADSGAFHKNVRAEITLRADSADALGQILPALKRLLGKPRPGLAAELGEGSAAKAGGTGFKESGVPAPAAVYRALREILPRDAILVADTGNHMLWSLEAYPVYGPDAYLAPVDFQAMGYAVPAAIALSSIRPKRKVVAAVGDACFLMSGVELLTASREGASLTVLVFADRSLGVIKETQERVYRRTAAVDLEPPDYASLAAGLKARHFAIRRHDDIEPVLKEALLASGPVLVEIDTVYAESSRFAKASMSAAAKSLDLAQKLRMGARLAGRFIRSKG